VVVGVVADLDDLDVNGDDFHVHDARGSASAGPRGGRCGRSPASGGRPAWCA
jgi:hypothetical protein